MLLSCPNVSRSLFTFNPIENPRKTISAIACVLATCAALVPVFAVAGCSGSGDSTTNDKDASVDGDATPSLSDSSTSTDTTDTLQPYDTTPDMPLLDTDVPDMNTDTQQPSGCVVPSSADVSQTNTWIDPNFGTSTVTIEDPSACYRVYSIATEAKLRDPSAISNPRRIEESEYWPTLRSGHNMLDALYALTLEETRQNSKAAINDGAFNHGRDLECKPGGCFKTGHRWEYVWTRDTAYAVDLGLAAMDPKRCENSLDFKLSERRTGGDLQIVQDTGSGGSYPVSTDRVVWAIGATELLNVLHGENRTAFRDRTLTALKNTIEHDRAVVFDQTDGLYRGEQSFLDWREQTYPPWTAEDVVHIAMSKALSTNLLHFHALTLASQLTRETGDNATSSKYEGYAKSLQEAIQKRFWLEEQGLFSTFVTTSLDPSATRRYDALGSALAVLFGVATPAQAKRVLENYPHYGPGVPVSWPQQQLIRVYHNRAEWPFVTAYWLRAAHKAGNATVAFRMIHALIRGTATNLSNMENFEGKTGAAWFEDGEYSGPEVNSEAQLWSVAGFISMIHHTLFGIQPSDKGITFDPFIPAKIRDELFGKTNEIVLNGYPYRDSRVTVVVHLPASGGTGALVLNSIKLNDQPVSGKLVEAEKLGETNRIDIFLDSGSTADGSIKDVDSANWQNVFGPRPPTITSIQARGRGLEVSFSSPESADVTLRVYRDGKVVADNLRGTDTSFIDNDMAPNGKQSPCYAVEAAFASGTFSQHSPPMCWWGTGNSHITTVAARDLEATGGVLANDHGREHYANWGDAGHSLTVRRFTAPETGVFLIQTAYGNGAGPINTGITCAVKRVVVEDLDGGAEVGSGILVMPHLRNWDQWSHSNLVAVSLTKGKTYRIVLKNDDRSINMSAFSHFEAYTGGLGGHQGEYNRVNIAEIKVLQR